MHMLRGETHLRYISITRQRLRGVAQSCLRPQENGVEGEDAGRSEQHRETV